MNPKLHLVYQGDCTIYLYDRRHLPDATLVRETGTHALVGEDCIYMEPKSSVMDRSMYFVHDGRQELSVGCVGVIQPGNQLETL